MSKEEFLKIQTCVLKVNVHCDGCKHKVKKILQKIEGVYTTKIDAEQGKVTVSGNVDPTTLIKKLAKIGKHAELWSAPKANNNQQNQLNNQFKNLQIGNGKGQSKNPNQKVVNPQPKGGQNPQHQQLKGIQDSKMPPQFMKDMKMLPPQLMKDMKMPFNGKDQNQKTVKFNVPEIDESGDDEFDESDYDEFDDDDDEFDDEMDDVPLNKMKPVMGNGHGGGQIPKMMMNNMMNMQHPQFMKGGANGGNNKGNAGGNGKMMMNNMMKGQHPQFMKGDGNGGGNNGGNAGGNGKKGGGAGNIPLRVNVGGNNDGKCGANFGKKGGNGNNNSGNQNHGGGKGGNNGGAQPQDGKNGGGNGGQNKNGNNVNGGGGGGDGANGAKKGGGMNDGFHGMPNMMAMNAMNAGDSMGQMGNMPMGQLRPMGNPQMGNFSAVQGIPTSAMNGGGGFQGPGIEHMAGNPHYQQQLAAMMMNQQRANGNERFQPMMYARPPPAVSYMPPYPPYPYPRHPGEQPDQYSMFSDENTSSCSVM